jgi:hypothetical protein
MVTPKGLADRSLNVRFEAHTKRPVQRRSLRARDCQNETVTSAEEVRQKCHGIIHTDIEIQVAGKQAIIHVDCDRELTADICRQ